MFEIDDGSTIKFWIDTWRGTCCLKEAYPKLFHLARDKDALVMDHMRYCNEVVSCVINFTHPAQDWELESLSSFLDKLYSSSAKGYGLDKSCWRGSS
jgi:hypothetical protein